MAVAKFIVTCLLPYRLVEKPGFKRFVKALKPGYEVVKRKALTETYIPRLFNTMKANIKAALSHEPEPSIAYTSDMWTSGAGEHFISLSAHFIDTSWKLHHIVLACRAFHPQHTGRNICDWYEEALKDWEITSKPTSFTTDNGENMRLAVDLLKAPHVRCIGHTLQTGVEDIEKKLPEVKAVTKRTQELRQFISSDKGFRAYEKYMKNRAPNATFDSIEVVVDGDMQTEEQSFISSMSPQRNQAARKLPSVSATRWWSEQPLRY